MRSDVLNKNSNAYDGKSRPTTIFDWNYINCGSPIVSHAQSSNSSGPVTATEHRIGMLWPGALRLIFESVLQPIRVNLSLIA